MSQEEYEPFKGTHVKVVQNDGYTTYGELTDIGADYILLKFYDKKRHQDTTALIKTSAIIKIMSW